MANWIAGAVKPANKGLFTKQAQGADMTTAGFANKVTADPDEYSGTTVKRANLAKTLRGITNKLKKA